MSNSTITVEEESDELIAKRIKTLVENGSIEAARKILSTIKSKKSRHLNVWEKVLAKPKVKIEGKATGGDLTNDILWLQQNSSNYQGQWIALKQGELLGNNESRLALHHSLKCIGKLAGSTFIWIDEE